MDRTASGKFIEQDLNRIQDRITRHNWVIEQNGIHVKVILKHEATGEVFSPFFSCFGYPRHPVKATFLPVSPIVYPGTKWPIDDEYVFRTRSPVPFICLPGLATYVPERVKNDNMYSSRDIHLGSLITRIYQAINSEKYRGFIMR